MTIYFYYPSCFFFLFIQRFIIYKIIEYIIEDQIPTLIFLVKEASYNTYSF
jgi:hypothetical protein